jgi:hypothetical protein
MADLPLEGRVVEEKKEVPLTDAQRIDLLTKDVQELARGINTQARLLESIVLAFDHVVKQYLSLTTVAGKPNEEAPEK